MRITFNIEKKHLYLLVLFTLVIVIGVVVATGWNGQQSHPDLFTNMIRARDNGNPGIVTIQDRLKIVDGTQGDNKVLTSDAGGLARWQAPLSTLSSQWTTVGSNIYYDDGSVGIGIDVPSATLHVAGNLRIDNSLLNNPVVTPAYKYMSINLGGTPYLIPLYLATTGLIGGLHTAVDCANAGGQVVSVIGGDICRFNLNYCPGGWGGYQSWSTTLSDTCQGVDPICGSSCTTGDHAWNNLDLETCQYSDKAWTGVDCIGNDYICSAFLTQTGCY